MISNFRTKIVFLSTIICLLGFLATTSLEPIAAGERVVTLKWLMRSNPVENKWQRDVVIPKFQAKHPNIRINLIVVPFTDVDPKLSAMVAAGDPPDIFSQWGESGFGDYYNRGLLSELTPLIERDINKNDFIPGIFDIYKVKERYYSVPQVTNFGVVMVYNKDLFAQAGLENPPTDWNDKSWTWDRMIEYAKKLTKNYGQGINAQYGIDSGPLKEVHGVAYLWGADPYLKEHYTEGIAKKSNLDDPGVVAALQAVADLTYKDKVAPTPAEAQTLSTLGNIFATGKIGMSFTLPTQAYGNFKSVPFKWGLAPLPRVKDNKTRLFNGTWFIAKGSKYKEEAWEFVKYLISEEAAVDMSRETGFLVPHKAAVEQWLRLFEKPTGMTLAELRQVILNYPSNSIENTNHLFVNWREIATTLSQGLDALWMGKEDAKTAIAKVKPKVDAVIKRTYEKFGEE